MALKKHSLLRSGSALSFLTLISRVLGLVREMTKAALLGTSALSDAFSVAFMIPNLFRRLFAEGSIAVAFIPTFKAFLIEDKHSETREFLCCFWTFLSFFVSLAVALGIVFTPFIVRIFGLAEFNETVLLTRIMFPFLLFISIAAFFQGILNSVHVFLPSGLAPIVLNIVTIACAWLLSPFTANPARALSFGIFLGGFLEALIQFPFVLKNKYFFKWTSLKKAVNNLGTRAVLRLIGPTIIGMAAYQLNDLVSTALAGNVGEGVVSSLQYSLRLQELILGVFAVSIGTVLLPELSEHAKARNWLMYNKRLTSAIDIIALITIPVTIFSLIESEKIVRLLFQSRLFDDDSVRLTTQAFFFHITGLFFIALNRILAPAFYAQSDSKSPTIAGVASFVVNMALAALLSGPLKGAGIALALSIAGAANTLLLFFFFKRIAHINLKAMLINSLRYLIRMVIFSCIAAVPLMLLDKYINKIFTSISIAHIGSSRLITVAAPLVVSLLIFSTIGIALLFITGDGNLKSVLSIFGRKLKKHN